jgi:transcription elongation factor
MDITRSIRNGAMTVAALGALALGGSAIAGAATSSSSSSTSTPGSSSTPAQGARPDPTKAGGHVGANGKTEQALSSDVAAKVKAAALAKVSGGTVLRVETDVDHGSPYEAHVQKSDGTEVEVLVDSGFNVTAVNTMGHR